MISGILFDLDGTLIDTWELYREAYRYVVQPYVRKTLTSEDIRGSKPTPEREFIKRCVPEKEREQAFRRFLTHYSNFHDSFFGGTYEGVEDMLDQLRNSGYPLGIVTGKSRAAWKITNQKCDLGNFDVMITDDDVDQYKPNIECLQTAINQMKLENTEILYVGDHLRDFEMAQKAGTPFAAVLWSKSPEEQSEFRDELKDDEVMWFFEHPEELLQKLGI